jgi:hypothetical protein
MQRVFLAWLFSLLIGSFAFGIIGFFVENKGIGVFALVGIFSLVLGAITSLPLLIIELIAASIVLKKSKNFNIYSNAKYFAAGLTVIIFILGTSSQKNEDFIFRVGGFLIALCYGIPGYIFHVKYIKPVFSRNEPVKFENEDLLDN